MVIQIERQKKSRAYSGRVPRADVLMKGDKWLS